MDHDYINSIFLIKQNILSRRIANWTNGVKGNWSFFFFFFFFFSFSLAVTKIKFVSDRKYEIPSVSKSCLSLTG